MGDEYTPTEEIKDEEVKTEEVKTETTTDTTSDPTKPLVTDKDAIALAIELWYDSYFRHPSISSSQEAWGVAMKARQELVKLIKAI